MRVINPIDNPAAVRPCLCDSIATYGLAPAAGI